MTTTEQQHTTLYPEYTQWYTIHSTQQSRNPEAFLSLSTEFSTNSHSMYFRYDDLLYMMYNKKNSQISSMNTLSFNTLLNTLSPRPYSILSTCLCSPSAGIKDVLYYSYSSPLYLSTYNLNSQLCPALFKKHLKVSKFRFLK